MGSSSINPRGNSGQEIFFQLILRTTLRTLFSCVFLGGDVMGNEYGMFRDPGGTMLPRLLLFQMKWTESLHGNGSLRECLTELSEMFGAQVVHLHRTCTRSGRQRTIASVDLEARAGARPLTRAIGPAILAATSNLARPGTVWTLDEAEDLARLQGEERTLRWLADRRFRDVAAIPLEQSGTELDILELYMSATLPGQKRATLECLAAAAATAWSRRQSGRIARVLSAMPTVSDKHCADLQPGRASLLSASNPSNLTAAETRICAMFRNGACTADIARILRISESTLRTHLRSIYAKAGVSGQVELVRVLLADPAPSREPRSALSP